MQRDTTKRYYVLHSWVGVLTAILLFVICFTGALSVFGRGELKVWANTDLRDQPAADYQAIQELVKEHAKQVPADYLDHVEVFFPGPHGASSLVVLFEKETVNAQGGHLHEAVWLNFDPHTYDLQSQREGEVGELFATRRTDMADFIVGFHADLHLGSPLGLILTGLLGLTLLASVVTGVIVHPKILKDLFSFRPWRSLRLLLTDTHKILGVWGLLFHGVIGFTGAFLGLATVLLIPAAAFVSFGGDQERLIETFVPEIVPEIQGQPLEMNFAPVLQTVTEQNPHTFLRRATIYGWGDAGAIISVASLGGEQLTAQTADYSLASGELIAQYSTFSRLQGVSKYILDALTPLHFGNFGGLAVKLLWFVLGISTALVAVTGMMVWIERRAYGAEGRLSAASYKRIALFSAGSCAGLVAACASLFWSQLLLPVPATDMSFYSGAVFFAVWVLSILWAMFCPNAYMATRELLFISGLACLLVLPLNGLITGDWLFNSALKGHFITAGVDLAVLLSGAALVWAGRALPINRPARKKDTRKSDNVIGGGTIGENSTSTDSDGEGEWL